MKLVEWLSDAQLVGLLLPGLLAGGAAMVFSAILSPFVVAKRAAFAGQGVSHCALGGVGVAAALGLLSDPNTAFSLLSPAGMIVVAFGLVSAAGVAIMTNNRSAPPDTAIGVLLVGSMAMGALLIDWAGERGLIAGSTPWENWLFGQLIGVTSSDAIAAGVLALVAIAWIALDRRALALWALDEGAAESIGMRVGLRRVQAMLLLGLAVLLTMRVAGVVLATAAIVLPGAVALQLARSLAGAIAISGAAAVAAIVLGAAVSLQLDLPMGSCVVLTLVAMLLAASGVARLRNGR